MSTPRKKWPLSKTNSQAPSWKESGFHAAILNSVDQAVIATDLDGKITYWNNFAETLYGWHSDEVVGRGIAEITVPSGLEKEGQEILARLSAGESWSGEFNVRRADGTTFTAYVIDSPIRDETGRVVGFVGVSRDNSERRRSDERQKWLLNEFSHRVKNGLATVLAIARQTMANADTMSEFFSIFEKRIFALGKTHALLMQNEWKGVPIQQILDDELAPYGNQSPTRILLTGPDVILKSGAALPVGMVIHELATNAAKYGALSTPAGSVRLRWSSNDSGVEIDWLEEGGPRVEPPGRSGFGMKFIEGIANSELRGKATLSFDPTGVHCKLFFSHHHVAGPLDWN